MKKRGRKTQEEQYVCILKKREKNIKERKVLEIQLEIIEDHFDGDSGVLDALRKTVIGAMRRGE